MLAHLPSDQLRALMSTPDAFIGRTGRGPRSLSTLRRRLSAEQAQGFAQEAGEVLDGYASVAAAVLDRAGRPAASVSVTYRLNERVDAAAMGRAVTQAAGAISLRG